jgi:hypothetical protein
VGIPLQVRNSYSFQNGNFSFYNRYKPVLLSLIFNGLEVVAPLFNYLWLEGSILSTAQPRYYAECRNAECHCAECHCAECC